MKKTIITLLSFVLISLPIIAMSQVSGYQPLEPSLVGLGENEKISEFGHYASLFIRMIIGAIAVIAVFKIVVGGIKYIGSDVVTKKQEGQEDIWNALGGLIIALLAYLILFTINPDLVEFRFLN